MQLTVAMLAKKYRQHSLKRSVLKRTLHHSASAYLITLYMYAHVHVYKNTLLHN